ncbi:hypothetical protein BJY52DRAFT_1302931 [Lactarius psammicola]|nr:hypothetical protein BJY52DRAFT_1302931 [Lactarius psammicola]
MLDTHISLVICLNGAWCANGVREAKGMKCKCQCVNNVDDRTRSEYGLVIQMRINQLLAEKDTKTPEIMSDLTMLCAPREYYTRNEDLSLVWVAMPLCDLKWLGFNRGRTVSIHRPSETLFQRRSWGLYSPRSVTIE